MGFSTGASLISSASELMSTSTSTTEPPYSLETLRKLRQTRDDADGRQASIAPAQIRQANMMAYTMRGEHIRSVSDWVSCVWPLLFRLLPARLCVLKGDAI